MDRRVFYRHRLLFAVQAPNRDTEKTEGRITRTEGVKRVERYRRIKRRTEGDDNARQWRISHNPNPSTDRTCDGSEIDTCAAVPQG